MSKEDLESNDNNLEYNSPFKFPSNIISIPSDNVENQNLIENEHLDKDQSELIQEWNSDIISKKSWRTHPIKVFKNKIMPDDQIKSMSKPLRKFYKKQNELIKELVELDKYQCDDFTTSTSGPLSDHCHRIKLSDDANICHKDGDEILAKIVFGSNLILLIAKAIASSLSGSLSIISSLVDSVTDLISGILMWWTSRNMKKFNPYLYPEGRRRLEPIFIIILSTVMSVASFQIIRESIDIIISMATKGKSGPSMDFITIGIVVSTILLKIILWIVCKLKGKTETSKALEQDSRNDVFSNIVVLICSTVSGRVPVKNLKYLDPIGAILIAIYIIYSWIQTGKENVKALSGHTASVEFLQKLTFITLNHHRDIQYVDTVRAFHFGTNFLVEIDIVLDENMILHKSHDIGESLQKRVEGLDEVERCFVHMDYEFLHNPKHEHKMV